MQSFTDPLEYYSWIRRISSLPLKYWIDNNLIDLVREISFREPNRKIHIFIQNNGEVVFIPYGWIHCVLNIEFSAAITHNFSIKKNIIPFLNDLEKETSIDKMEFLNFKNMILKKYKGQY